MRIFLTGATGFIGRHLLLALSARGHEVTCLARGERALALAAMALPGVRVVEGQFTRPREWANHIDGCDVVVNTVGIIREMPGSRFEAVHTEAPAALFEAAAGAGVRKIVQLSALGADEAAVSRFHRSKRAADLKLAALGVPYVILRPALVYGEGDHSMTFFLSLAALPVTPVPGDGQYRVQPVHVDDLVHVMILAIEREALAGRIIDVAGGQALTFDAMLDALARWLGKPGGARKLHVPWGVMRGLAAVTDALGGHGPITGEELQMLRRGNAADIWPFVEQFGFEPAPFEVGMARRPLSEAALWHARLMHLRLPLRLSVGFVWLATGFISAFVYPERLSLAMLAQTGITGRLAPVVLYGTSFFEIALGLATAFGCRLRWVGAIELLLIVAFTTIISIYLPGFWWHPFGALTKNIPFILATLVMMALEA